MKILRSKLLAIYSTLSNEDKTSWATECSYASTQSLYNYLSRNDNVAEDLIISALVATIGEDNFYLLFKQLHNIDLQISSNFSDINFESLYTTLHLSITQALSVKDPELTAKFHSLLDSASKAFEGKLYEHKICC